MVKQWKETSVPQCRTTLLTVQHKIRNIHHSGLHATKEYRCNTKTTRDLTDPTLDALPVQGRLRG